MARSNGGKAKAFFRANPSGAFDQYLQDIQKLPLIRGPDEERRLARRVQRGDEKAAERLVTANLRFVISYVKKYQGHGLDLSELVAIGNEGLLKAVKKFDPDQGVKFISYAVWWVRQAVLKALAEQTRSVRIPLNQNSQLIRMSRTETYLSQELGRRHAARGAHVLDGVLERHRDLVVGRLPAELLRQVRLGAAHADELRVLIQRDANATGLLGERLQDRLTFPPYRIRDELHALIGIELLHRLEQPLVPDGDQLGEVEAVPLILLDVGDDESEVGGDESLGGFFVTPLHASRQAAFFSGILDEWELLDVLQILVEGTGRIGAKERLRLASVRPRHS